MTSKLEQEFFSMFGIKQEYQYHVRDMGRSYIGNKQMLIDNKHLFMDKERKRSRRLYVANVSKIYPDITAEKLLQLLCIVIDEYNRNGRTFYLESTNVKELKEDILDALMGCIDASCDLFEIEVKQVQQLFKEA